MRTDEAGPAAFVAMADSPSQWRHSSHRPGFRRLSSGCFGPSKVCISPNRRTPMSTRHRNLVASACTALVLLTACRAPPLEKSGVPSHPPLAFVEGAALPYADQGRGEIVVFVHGAFSDRRVWDGQRDAIARRFRFIALDQRYFGPTRWPDAGERYSAATHANDLAAFIRQFDAGPVHLVGSSSGGAIVLTMAVQHPELVRSIFVNEPSLSSIVTDAQELDRLAQERKGLADAIAASKAGDQPAAVRLFADWVNARPGSFEALPPDARAIHLENARTLPLQFASPPPPAVSCPELQQIKVSTTVAQGAQSSRYFSLLADAAARCIPGARKVVIGNAQHMAPVQNAAAFNAALLAHLEGAAR